MVLAVKKITNPSDKKDCAILLLFAAITAAVISFGINISAYFIFGPTSIGTWYNKYWLVFFWVFSFVPLTIFVFKDSLVNKPENFYLIIALSVTLFFSWSTGTGLYSWDDELHYKNALIWSDLDENIELSTADSLIINDSKGELEEKDIASIYNREYELNSQNANVAQVLEVSKTISNYFTKIAYFPSSLVLAICQLINLPFSISFILGKISNGFLYSLITFFGMKKLITGKMLYAVIALLPTAVFLASNYSYDWWVNAFILYGFGSLAGIIQDPSQKISTLRAFKIPLLIILGSLPKLIYMPLFILCILIPGRRFKSKQDKYIFKGTLLGIPLIILVSLCVYTCANPSFLYSLVGSGDMRGGLDVNSPAQLEYIINNPLAYASSIVSFLMPPIGHDAIGNTISGMLSPGGLKEIFTFYAYLGILPKYYCAVIILLLIITVLTDKNKYVNYKHGTWILPFVITFCLLIAIISALYISFTGVGSHEIHGVQGRYFIPLLFPLLIWVGTNKLAIANKSNTTRAIYNCSILSVMFLILMSSWWIMYIRYVY